MFVYTSLDGTQMTQIEQITTDYIFKRKKICANLFNLRHLRAMYKSLIM